MSRVCAISLRLSELYQQLLEGKKKALQVKTAIFNVTARGTLLIRSKMTCTPDKAPTRCLAVTPTQHVGRDLLKHHLTHARVQDPKTPFYLKALLKAQSTADPKHALCLRGPYHYHVYTLDPFS